MVESAVKSTPTVRPAANGAGIPFAVRRLSLEEYHQLIESGFFAPEERVELLEGVLHVMSPRGPRHVECLSRLLRCVFSWVGAEAIVRVQDPVTITGAESEPEPDLVLAKPRRGGYPDRHPGPEYVA